MFFDAIQIHGVMGRSCGALLPQFNIPVTWIYLSIFHEVVLGNPPKA